MLFITGQTLPFIVTVFSELTALKPEPTIVTGVFFGPAAGLVLVISKFGVDSLLSSSLEQESKKVN